MPAIELLDSRHDRTGFDCGVTALNNFLKATARQHARKGISRTFVLTEESNEILGFFTLTLCEVIAEDIPAKIAREYPTHSLPAVRLARLAVSRRHQKKGYGELLLADAVNRTRLIAGQAGLIGLLVDAKDESASRFYQRFGFTTISSDTLQLFMPIGTILSI